MDKLYHCVKKRSVSEFLKISAQSQLPLMIPKLENPQFIKVLNFHKTLHISDNLSWKALESSFLSRKFTALSFSDYTNLVYCFSRNSKNPNIWQILEVEILKRMGDFKKDLIFTPEGPDKIKLGIVMHSFAKAEHFSPALWTEFGKLILDCYHLLTHKNIGMIILAYEACPNKDDKVIDALEKAAINRIREISVQNMVVVCYCMAKMGKGSGTFWVKWENILAKNINGFNTRDFTQILWSFSKMKQGSKDFWNQLEEFTINNCPKFEMIDYNHAIYSFLLIGSKSTKLWETLENYVKTTSFSNVYAQKTPESFTEILFISHVFEQTQCQNKEFWDILGLQYADYKKSPAFLKAPVKFNYHLGILLNNKQLWDESLENLFRETLNSNAQDPIYLKFLIDAIYLAFLVKSPPVSESFQGFLLEKLLETDFSNPNVKLVNDVAGVAALFCVFLSKAAVAKGKDYEAIVKFITLPQNVEVFVKNGKAFSLFLKRFSNNWEEPRFWHAYCGFFAENKAASFVTINHVSNLIIAILETNRIGFKFELHANFNRKNEAILKENRPKFERMIEKIARILQEGRKFKDVNEIQTALEMPEVNLSEFTKNYEKKVESMEEFQREKPNVEKNNNNNNEVNN